VTLAALGGQLPFGGAIRTLHFGWKRQLRQSLLPRIGTLEKANVQLRKDKGLK
jgi:hypothetical protein